MSEFAAVSAATDPKPVIEFWFDLSSPYAYFASLEIDQLAERHGRTVLWRPFLLGVLFQVTGSAPLTEQPMKGDYVKRDWARLARLAGVPFMLRDDFPSRTQVAARMILAIEEAAGAQRAGQFAKMLFRTLFADGLDIGDATVATAVAAEMGLDACALDAAARDPRWKTELRHRCDQARTRGIFGAPWFVVNGEPFWGADRLPMLEQWLANGPW